MLNQFHGQMLNTNTHLDMVGQALDTKVLFKLRKYSNSGYVKWAVLLYFIQRYFASFKCVYSGML